MLPNDATPGGVAASPTPGVHHNHNTDHQGEGSQIMDCWRMQPLWAQGQPTVAYGTPRQANSLQCLWPTVQEGGISSGGQGGSCGRVVSGGRLFN